MILLRNQHISSDLTLSAARPYLIADSLTVESGATLTLEAGVRLLFPTNAHLRVDGKLVAKGTMERPVQLRGERMDFIFDNQPYDRIPDQWQGVLIGAKSFGNQLNWCDIHSGAYGILCEPSEIGQEKIRIENSVIHNVSGTALDVCDAQIFVGNTQITNAGGYCVKLIGGDARFVHCTIANFYPYSALRGEAVLYSNYLDKTPHPLIRATFENCLISGYSDDEILGYYNSKDSETPFNYYFSHCLLNTPETQNDSTLIGNMWESEKDEVGREKNFPHWNLDYLYFDFHLDSLSKAIGIGDTTITRSFYPLDRSGQVRLSDGKSDAGCYEFVARRKEQ